MSSRVKVLIVGWLAVSVFVLGFRLAQDGDEWRDSRMAAAAACVKCLEVNDGRK